MRLGTLVRTDVETKAIHRTLRRAVRAGEGRRAIYGLDQVFLSYSARAITTAYFDRVLVFFTGAACNDNNGRPLREIRYSAARPPRSKPSMLAYGVSCRLPVCCVGGCRWYCCEREPRHC